MRKTGKTVQNVRDIAELKLSGQTAAELSKHPIAYDPGYVLAAWHVQDEDARPRK